MGFDDLVARQQGDGSPPDPAFLAESRASHMLVGNILVQSVGCLFVFMRVYSRLVIIKTWRLEDWVLVAAWLCATGFSICQYGQIHHGAGRHLVALLMGNPRDPVESQKFAYAGQIVIFPALALPKLSICLAYLRIFFNDKKGRRMIQVLMVFLVLVIIPFDVEVILQCNPIHVYWSEGRPRAKCINDIAGFYISGSVNVLVDIALMAIVLPRIMELQLHRRQRWALIAVVSLGSLAIVAGITRMVRIGTIFRNPNFDPSWDSYDVSIWTSTEIYVTLICASAPGIKPFVKQALPKLLGTSVLSRTRRTGPTNNTYELGSKWKRNTTASSKTLRRQESETALAAAAGPYTECGRGVDAESLGDRSGVNSSWRGGGDDGAIYKTSEIHVRTTPA